jgi:hypothetical protein
VRNYLRLTWVRPDVAHRVASRFQPFLALVLAPLVMMNAGHAQTDTNCVELNGCSAVTGILLVDDERCDERRTCPQGASQWGLITSAKQYSVRGNADELKKYERRRVTVTGTITVVGGIDPHLVAADGAAFDILNVRTISPSEIGESEIRALIEQLRSYKWTGPHNISNPTFWAFDFTPPMVQILQAGPAAQDALLEYLDDVQIKDQIIVLLGGVGDGKAVAPMIAEMATPKDGEVNEYERNINRVATLALGNITVGGSLKCDDSGFGATPIKDPKACWSAWWAENGKGFDVSRMRSRNFTGYPNYGIYQNPYTFRAR